MGHKGNSEHAFPVTWARQQFPAIVETLKKEQPFLFSDNAAGSQVCRQALEAARDYMVNYWALGGGDYQLSKDADAYVDATREEARVFLGARGSDEIIFGLNATNTLRLLSTALSPTLQPGDEIIISGLEHEANVTPWLRLQKAGVHLKFWKPRGNDFRLFEGDLKALLTERTRLLAVTAASNLLGTVPQLVTAAELVHEAGGIVVVDGVHYAPHKRMNFAEAGIDFYVCSGYKFFAPTVSLAVCTEALNQRLQSLNHYFLNEGKLEIGAQNYAGIAGLRGVFTYLKELGRECGLGENADYSRIFAYIGAYERILTEHMLARLRQIDGLTLFGVQDDELLDKRVSTFSFRLEGQTPEETSSRLSKRGIACRHGHSYAARLADHMRIGKSGGTVRISLCHYNTLEEVDRMCDVIERIR